VQVIDPEIYATERVRPLRRAEYERLAALGFERTSGSSCSTGSSSR
jgi:hypothetical protein